jgi:hypothetical protein
MQARRHRLFLNLALAAAAAMALPSGAQHCLPAGSSSRLPLGVALPATRWQNSV